MLISEAIQDIMPKLQIISSIIINGISLLAQWIILMLSLVLIFMMDLILNGLIQEWKHPEISGDLIKVYIVKILHIFGLEAINIKNNFWEV